MNIQLLDYYSVKKLQISNPNDSDFNTERAIYKAWYMINISYWTITNQSPDLFYKSGTQQILINQLKIPLLNFWLHFLKCSEWVQFLWKEYLKHVREIELNAKKNSLLEKIIQLSFKHHFKMKWKFSTMQQQSNQRSLTKTTSHICQGLFWYC